MSPQPLGLMKNLRALLTALSQALRPPLRGSDAGCVVKVRTRAPLCRYRPRETARRQLISMRLEDDVARKRSGFGVETSKKFTMQ